MGNLTDEIAATVNHIPGRDFRSQARAALAAPSGVRQTTSHKENKVICHSPVCKGQAGRAGKEQD